MLHMAIHTDYNIASTESVVTLQDATKRLPTANRTSVIKLISFDCSRENPLLDKQNKALQNAVNPR